MKFKKTIATIGALSAATSIVHGTEANQPETTRIEVKDYLEGINLMELLRTSALVTENEEVKVRISSLSESQINSIARLEETEVDEANDVLILGPRFRGMIAEAQAFKKYKTDHKYVISDDLLYKWILNSADPEIKKELLSYTNVPFSL